MRSDIDVTCENFLTILPEVASAFDQDMTTPELSMKLSKRAEMVNSG